MSPFWPATYVQDEDRADRPDSVRRNVTVLARSTRPERPKSHVLGPYYASTTPRKQRSHQKQNDQSNPKNGGQSLLCSTPPHLTKRWMPLKKVRTKKDCIRSPPNRAFAPLATIENRSELSILFCSPLHPYHSCFTSLIFELRPALHHLPLR